MTDALQPLLLAEALMDRGSYLSGIYTKEMKEVAVDLKKREEIPVRRADKTAAFVLISTLEYFEKLAAILSNVSKFERLTKNPTEEIKHNANRVITAVNAATNATHLPPIQGDYSLGYLYRNEKTHKEGNPICQIISQTPAPTYALAKRLNKILTPYIPSRYCLTSSVEFLEKIRDSSGAGTMVSLDVESLFTNMYCVAMGSPLGVLFANFYMGETEERVFSQHRCPRTYGRYIDDIFVQADCEDEVEALWQQFLQHSALNFTVEYSSDDRLPFLDVLVTKTNQKLVTTVYTKATNLGLCLNGDSECPAWFKTTTVRAFVRRALSHCSTW
ncbi:uncharacterized protein LOC135196473 [Macrobrachium nipponense]|uniref:uncharacterized protein LOC135196473 n=1 Tax=Macrobrachium nipponense TaxID=159736 RepID=UPI0030C7FD43